MVRLMLVMIGVLMLAGRMLAGQAAADTLDDIAASKILHIGFIDDQAPFAAKEADGIVSGYAIDLCNRIAVSLRQQIPDLQVVEVETNLTDAFHDIITRKIDLLCGAVTDTLSRRELVDFSQAIFVTGMSALLRKDSPADVRDFMLAEPQVSPPRSPMMRAFASHIFGVRAGSTTAEKLREAIRKLGVNASVIDYETHEAGLTALRKREIDAYFADRGLLIGLLQKHPEDTDLLLADRWFTHEPYAIGLSRGDVDFRLLVDRALTDEEHTHLYRLYLDVKARNLNLNCFDLPPMLFRALEDPSTWEFVLLRLKPEYGGDASGLPVAFMVSFKGSEQYVPLLCGLDYRFVRSHGAYRQLLRQVIQLANRRGFDRLYFGFGASHEKTRFGARLLHNHLYIQNADHYHLEVLRELMSTSPARLARQVDR